MSISNGVFSSANWNCGVLPSGYVGQTNFTFTPNSACALDLDICFNPTNGNPVIITYTITLADGCICTKTDIKKCPCALISGELWHDVNNDGNHDPGENALFPYDVYLVNSSGIPIMTTTTTSPSGAYTFSCMPPGQYYVQFDPPPGYEPSPGNATGSSPTSDSDIDLGNGTYNTNPINVSNGDTITDLDAGVFY